MLIIIFQKVVLNLVYLDDPCIVNDRNFTLTTRRDNQSTVDVIIVENDSIEDEIIYECTNPLMCLHAENPFRGFQDE